MTPINPTPIKKKKKILRDEMGNPIKRSSSSPSPTLVRRPLRKLKRITLPPLEPVVVAPPKPKVLVGHTPEDLVEIWEEKIPWLHSIVDVPATAGAESGYLVQRPGDHYDFNCIANTGPSPSQYASATFKAVMQDRWIQKAIGNQYFFTRLTAAYQEDVYTRMLAAAKPVKFADLKFTKGLTPSPAIVDLRTKLFMLLAGMYEIQFGYDPEFFALNEAQMPTKFKADGVVGHWVRDGLAWEAHTSSPARCLNNLLNTWHSATSGVCPTSERYKNYPQYIPLSVSPKLAITPSIRATLTESDLELGCNPSENIYGLTSDMALASMTPARWAGGHVHINLPAVHCNPTTVARCIRNVDAIAGVALVNMVGDWDDTQRRQFYGQAGEFRTKPYGFEYRTPSNQMWTSSYMLYAFLEIMRMAVKMALAELDYEDIGFDTTQEEVIRTIQDNNKAMALAVIERNLPIYSAIFEAKSNFSYQSFGPLSAVLRVGDCADLLRDYYGLTQPLSTVWGARNQLSQLGGGWPSKYQYAMIK